jgi:G6PDH family F420-dependent oxidoreductase
MPTEIGYFLSGEELGPDVILKSAIAAESAGFDRIWVSDHFHPWQSSQDESPFVWSVLGAIAATTNLHMTTAVTCPTFRIHPAILAQATATLGVLAPGRFTFGVGSGEALNEHIFGDAWPPVSVRHERLEEALEIIRKLWTGDIVTHEGKYFTVHNAKLWSLPQEPPPILISGFGPAATELAARIGDGFIAVKPDADALKLYRDHGGKGIAQGGMKICYAETEQEGAETAYKLWGHEGIGGQSAQDLPMWHEFESLAEAGSPEQMAKSIPCGPDAAKAAEAISAYIDAGFDEVYVAQMGPDQEGGIRFLSEEVLPLLKKS